MKISYNWLKNYLSEIPAPEQTAEMLTNCGLEVEAIEKHDTIKGGLAGLVVGKIITKEKHPDADRLSITTVDTGSGTLLNIVCGAPNVAAGQKVIVALIGATLYPAVGEPFEIKKSKIRGQLSEGMICAEDEIGLGTSHAGVMVLAADTKVGTPANEYFKLETDYIFEIGLTPNRADAASHIGVARDLYAVLISNSRFEISDLKFEIPPVEGFQIENTDKNIEVIIEDTAACARYSGVTMSNIKVTESPEWLKNKLKAIGVRPINNIVDATNYVMFEAGQPLHAFDADRIAGNKIVVKKLAAKTKFKTLDDVERTLSADDLMICDSEKPMCIAGVFGGKESGVSDTTTSIFIESAYFNSTSVRKSSKFHSLKTDASFRFERGTDPNITVYALKRVALLIKEISEATISSEIIDVYPTKIKNVKIPFSFARCEQMIGKHIDIEIIKTIITSLGIEIEHEGHDALLLGIPAYKVDVTREQDVIEEVLRIYGYNNIEIPVRLNSSLTFSETGENERVQNAISQLLTDNGFSEIMGLSLTKEEYSTKIKSLNTERNVKMMNPLSSDLNVLRQTLLTGGLEAIAYNQNRRNADLKLYEFGKTYTAIKTETGTKYIETKHLSVLITGRKEEESWNTKNDAVNIHTLKGIVKATFERTGIANAKMNEYDGDIFSSGFTFSSGKKKLVEAGTVSKAILKLMDIKQEVFYADFNWDAVVEQSTKTNVMYTEVSKFPEVRRDLALLVDKTIKFEQLEQLAFQSEKKLLKSVNLFDIYEGDKLPTGKKSYALSFILQDETATLTDKQIDKTMETLIKNYQEKVGAEIR